MRKMYFYSFQSLTLPAGFSNLPEKEQTGEVKCCHYTVSLKIRIFVHEKGILLIIQASTFWNRLELIPKKKCKKAD